MEEKEIWAGSPSQWTNFAVYLVCIPLSFFLGIGIVIALWRYLATRSHKYEITDQRIIETKGILSKTTDELELYRVKDVKHDQPFLLGLFGLSSIILSTNDRSHPNVIVLGIKNGRQLREQLRTAIESRRDKKRVVEFELR